MHFFINIFFNMRHIAVYLTFTVLLAGWPGISIFGQTGSESKPFVLGITREIPSAALSEKRVLNIYLPEGYTQNDTARYPVIYLLDGTANEDFVHICGLVQFFNMMDMMPRAIVVGIANIDRKRDFTYPTTIEKDRKDFPTTGGSARFIAFLEKELQPYIEKSFRTSASRTLIGQSLGGLLATEILFKKPEMFNHYIIVSPSLWWDNESLLKVQPKFTQTTAVFLSVGKEGKIMERDARDLLKKLKKNKPENFSVAFEYLPKEDHATILHEAVYRAFKALFGKK